MRDLWDAPWWIDDKETTVTKGNGGVDVQPKYRGNVLNEFENGVGLDLRVKLAMEMLKGPGPWSVAQAEAAAGCQEVRTPAAWAFETAEDLLLMAAERGLLYALPDHGELTQPLRHHIERNARAQAYSQAAGGRAMREEMGSVAVPMHPALNG